VYRQKRKLIEHAVAKGHQLLSHQDQKLIDYQVPVSEPLLIAPN
jgi:hypothetical protein